MPFIDFEKFFPRCQHLLMEPSAARKGVARQVLQTILFMNRGVFMNNEYEYSSFQTIHILNNTHGRLFIF